MFMKQSEKLLIGKKYCDRLNVESYDVIWIPDNPNIDKRLSGHADLSVFTDGRGQIFTAKHLDIPNSIKIDEDQSEKYPADVQLNAITIGNNAVICEKYVSRKIFEHLKKGKWNTINVNQGYARCSTLAVDNNSIITSDISIFLSCINNGIDALLIKPGFIDLEGFDYGFIGGCGANINGDLLLTGHLEKHPSKNEILKFIDARNINIKYLSSDPIFDIGGILTL